jgi:hypothetical protein
MSIPDAIRAAAPRPVLIIADGVGADEPVADRWFQAASPSTVQVWSCRTPGTPRAWPPRPGLGKPT